MLLRVHSRPQIILLHAIACPLAAAFILISSACLIVPVRLPIQTKDISGNVQNLDFTFLKAGSTARDEVAKKLTPIDTHTSQADFFWGRWESSKWAVGGFAGLGYGAVAGGGRVWGARNIFVSIDENGVVSNWIVVDDKNLFHQLDVLDSPGSSPAEAMPAVREVERPASSEINAIHTAYLAFSRELLECGEVKISRSNIQKITTTAEDAVHPSADHVWIIVHLLRRTSGKKGVKSLTMGVDPPTLLLLCHYIKQGKSAATTVSKIPHLATSVKKHQLRQDQVRSWGSLTDFVAHKGEPQTS